MKARAQGDDYLGMDPKIVSEALSVLNNISTTIRVVGPIPEPRLVFDVKGLQDELKKAASEAAKKRGEEEIEKDKKKIDRQNDVRKYRALERNKLRLSGQSLHEYNALRIMRVKESREKAIREMREMLNAL